MALGCSGALIHELTYMDILVHEETISGKLWLYIETLNAQTYLQKELTIIEMRRNGTWNKYRTQFRNHTSVNGGHKNKGVVAQDFCGIYDCCAIDTATLLCLRKTHI